MTELAQTPLSIARALLDALPDDASIADIREALSKPITPEPTESGTLILVGNKSDLGGVPKSFVTYIRGSDDLPDHMHMWWCDHLRQWCSWDYVAHEIERGVLSYVYAPGGAWW